MGVASPGSDRARRWFWATAIAVQLGVVATAVAAIGTGGSPYWAGAALPGLGLLGWLAWMYLRDTPRTDSDLPWLPALAGAGVILAGAASWTAMGLAGVGFAVDLAYVVWYSRLARAPSPRLVLTQTLPLFEVQEVDGTPVRSNTLRGRSAILLFYRGNWCPICVAQVSELAARYRELAVRDVQVLCISPQPEARTARLARRFDVPIRFLVDPGGQAARALGLYHADGVPAGFGVLGYGADTVFPTLVITDPAGVVVFLDQTDNYRVRPEPDTFLRVLDALG